MKTRLTPVALLIALSLAGCTTNGPAVHAPDATTQSAPEASDTTSATRPDENEAAGTRTPPTTPIADTDVCVEAWYADAARVENRWDLLEEALAADFYYTAPPLASGVLIPLLEGLTEHDAACRELAEPLIEAVTELAGVDPDDWQMFPDRYRIDLEVARGLMRKFLTVTGNMPPVRYGVEMWEHDGVIGLQDATGGAVFWKDSLRTGPEVEQAFAQGDLETGGDLIAAPVFVANHGPDMYQGEVDFLWAAASGRQYRPTMVISDDGSIDLPRRSVDDLEDVANFSSLLVFFDIVPGDADGEAYATIDGRLWANLTDPASENILEITEDWRLVDD